MVLDHKATYSAAVSNQQRIVLSDFGRAWRTVLPVPVITGPASNETSFKIILFKRI